MKRKILTSLLTLCMLTAFVPWAAVAYDEMKYGGYLYYRINEDGLSVRITDCDENITSIGQNTFMDCTSLTDVYYSGSKTEWENIDIDERENDPLLHATIHYGKFDPITPAALTVAPDTAGAAKIKFFVWTNTVQPVTLAAEITLNWAKFNQPRIM